MDFQANKNTSSSQSIAALAKKRDDSWQTANVILNPILPFSRPVWNVVYAEYGHLKQHGLAGELLFAPLEPTLREVFKKGALIADVGTETSIEGILLSRILELVGQDVAASVCLVTEACRRVNRTLSLSISRPIFDDLLMRVHLGYLVGAAVEPSVSGKGMLAAFAGRFGLLMQLASGSDEQASNILNALASGEELGKVSAEIYGCDQLDIGVLTLVTAGVRAESVHGILGIKFKGRVLASNSESYFWYMLSILIEGIRSAQLSTISTDIWSSLGITEAKKEDLLNATRQLQRRGHGYRWILE